MERKGICAVIVTVEAEAELMPALEAHARYGLTRFPEFDGFISGALHKSADGTRLVQYLRWRSEVDHLACIDDPRWDDDPSSQRFLDLVASERATMGVQVYEVVADTETEPPSE